MSHGTKLPLKSALTVQVNLIMIKTELIKKGTRRGTV